MKSVTLWIVIVIVAGVPRVYSQDFQSTELGFSMRLPSNWKVATSPTDPANPQQVYEAVKEGSGNEFMMVFVFPSPGLAVGSERKYGWAKEMLGSFGAPLADTLKADCRAIGRVDWFCLRLVLNGQTSVYLYNCFLNGYSYVLSFISNSPDFDKRFESECESIVVSVVLTRPGLIAAVQSCFAEPDTSYTIPLPNHAQLKREVSAVETPPYAYALYKSLLNEGNADGVVVSRNYQAQLYCMNMKQSDKVMTPFMLNIVSGMVSKMLEKDGNLYDEIHKGMWNESEGRLYLHKFRLMKPSTQAHTQHFIFYSVKLGNTQVWKIQIPASLEADLSECIERWALKNL